MAQSNSCQYLTKTPIWMLVLYLAGENTALQSSCLMRICYLLTTTEPSPVISFEITSPILVLNVINSMRCHYNAVIFPIFHYSVLASNGNIKVGNNNVVTWQL